MLNIQSQKLFTMKTHHYIFLTTALFAVLFYKENIGLNLGILAIVYTILTYFKTLQKNRTTIFMVFIVTSVLSGIAFSWYGDIASFLAVVISVLLLSYRSRNRRMKILLLIPVFIVNCFSFICRVFNVDRWLPIQNTSGLWQKTLAFIFIPVIFISVFFGIYSAGSDHFARLFTDYELDIDLWQLICISVLGFFIAFNYWNYVVEKMIYKQNHIFENEFQNKDKIQKPTYSFLDLNSERMSGVISFFCLNILLVFFIITFNYEQFYEAVITPEQLSQETHERVSAVIMSIIMAILVIMFYFKSNFNFDPKAGLMKVLAKIWIVFNGILVISALLKNTEYIVSYGFTYKRLGVYAFLILSLIGLIMTFIKIQMQKKNVFLFNALIWYFYGTVLACSYINWGGIITAQNMKRDDFDLSYHLQFISFSEKHLLKYAEQIKDRQLEKEVLEKTKIEKSKTLLSKILYYETIHH